jgi:penicillin-binding protein 2
VSLQTQPRPLERLNVLALAMYACGVLLGARLMQLQLVQGLEYSQAAERNRTQIIYQTAPRGRIYDRNGAPLATNQAAFSLIFLPGKKRDPLLIKRLSEALAPELRQKPEELLETLEQAVREQTAIRLGENLPPHAMYRLSELKTIYPGIDLIVEARRYYPNGRFASHLLGYMGRMDPRKWKELKTKGYRVDSRIGRLGLEEVFENELRGIDGGLQMEVDAQGRLKRVLQSIPWQAGSNVHLTIDAAIQKAADEGLRASATGRGAVVAIDPRNGAILALSSAPDFDPNALLSSDPEVVKATVAGLPEFNLAIAGTYPPGSTFKPIVSAAAFNEGRFSTSETIFCPGYFELGNHVFLCWEHKGHKAVTWPQGLAKSCDVYYYKQGLKTGGPLIERYAQMFGLGQKTNIALKGEKKGNLFGPTGRARSKRAWFDGDTINLSIGQGELLVTPIQMAVMIGAIANHGTLWRPHFTDRIVYTEGRPEYKQTPEKVATVHLKPETWATVEQGLREVITTGTGYSANIPGLEVYGKTGTAQNPGEDHAWFVSYAKRPGEEATIAVAVLAQNAGHGATAAAPIAKKVFLAAFGLQDGQPAPAPLKDAKPALGPALPGPAGVRGL